MLVSLVGIIWIQTSWIGDAIAEQERDFKVRVNEALNTVNDSIDTEEVELFLTERFGGVDSLLKDVVFFPDDGGNSLVEVNVTQADSNGHRRDEMTIIHSSTKKPSDRVSILQDSVGRNRVVITDDLKSDSTHAIVWSERIETHLDELDSTVKEGVTVEERRVNSFVKRYTYESMLSGDLEDRIDPKDLKGKLAKALKKEGINGKFAYAVKNGKTGNFETDYTSNTFKKEKSENAFAKKLFQSDRGNRMNYTLYVQPEDSGNFVWSKVWKMTALSVVFTVLILLSFGYALYFIFKQKKVSQIKNDFINNMTHELKTPLASISIATASIKHPEIVKNPEEIRRLAKMIEDEKERINTHVERVLDTAALDSGELKLSMERVPLISILQSAAKNVDLSLRNINGSLQMPESLDVEVEGDAFHLISVFTNILDNSIKYRSDKTPDIQVKCEIQKGTIHVSISDNGIGMTSKQQKHAFDKFYRAETGNIHNRKGFGLGLSYVKSVVEKHRGNVRMESKLNEGTTVIVELPKP